MEKKRSLYPYDWENGRDAVFGVTVVLAVVGALAVGISYGFWYAAAYVVAVGIFYPIGARITYDAMTDCWKWSRATERMPRPAAAAFWPIVLPLYAAAMLILGVVNRAFKTPNDHDA